MKYIRSLFSYIMNNEYHMFDFRGSPCVYKSRRHLMPSTTEEAWAIDSKNISSDFVKALGRLDEEVSQNG